MARALGLDVGNRRIGVAVSDASKLIARPLCVIDRKVEDGVGRVLALVAEQGADEVIVGHPLNTNGSVGPQAARVEQFVEQLRVHLNPQNVPLVLVDERYSTQDAREIAQTKLAKHQPKHDDALAAAVILQRYLDGKRLEIRDWRLEEDEDDEDDSQSPIPNP
jgi:putative Holliday junction resolvase